MSGELVDISAVLRRAVLAPVDPTVAASEAAAEIAAQFNAAGPHDHAWIAAIVLAAILRTVPAPSQGLGR